MPQNLTPKIQKKPHLLIILIWIFVALCLLGSIGKFLFDRYLQNALLEASSDGDDGRLRSLLRMGANPNFVLTDGAFTLYSPLMRAADNKKWSTVHLLLSAGAKPTMPGEGLSPLHFAVQAKNLNIVIELLKSGADPNGSTGGTDTNLSLAVGNSDLPIVTALLDAEADPNSCSDTGFGAERNRLEIVKLMLAHGANVNMHARSTGLPRYHEGGYTPLMFAVKAGNKEITQFLLAHGASPKVKWTPMNPERRDIQTPLRTAEQNKRLDLANLLRQAGATE